MIAILGRLLTKERLSKWGIATDESSVLCCLSFGSYNHPVFEYLFSKWIWGKLVYLISVEVLKILV